MKEVKQEKAVKGEEVGGGIEYVDIAIVGGGIGGVYTAWRMQNAYAEGRGNEFLQANQVGAAPTIKIYESSNRIGGRLESLNPPGAPHLVAEFGGMGFSTNHVRVAALVKYLGLQTKPLILGTDNSINYLRGKYFLNSQVNNPAMVPYNLNPAEAGKSYGQILVEAIDRFLPGNENWSDAEWRNQMYNVVTFNGLPLYQVSLWNVLLSLISNEAYNYSEDAMGHMPFLGAWNAAEALPWNFIDDRSSTTDWTIVGGYDQIVLTPFQQYVNAGGAYAMNKRLVTFNRGGDGKMNLFFDDGTQVVATLVILAMPRRALELITEGSPLENVTTQSMIQSVTPVPHMKAFLAYPYAWWKADNVSAGHSITDLPLRALYYEGTENEQGGDPNNYNSLLMAAYMDERFVGYWEGLQQGAMYQDQPNPWITPPPNPDYWHSQPISVNMVNELQNQLMQVHKIYNIPMPYSAAWRDWSEDPYGGAWNCWNVGVNAMQMIPQMIMPIAGMPIYICGSAYSHWQGWAEGALETADLLLYGAFGMDKPSWQA